MSIDVPAGKDFEKRLLREVKAALEGGRYAIRLILLDYLDPASSVTKCRPVRKDGLLGRLKLLAHKLARFWDEAAAVWFVLTGQAPPIPLARTRLTYDSRGQHRITLELAPHLKPEEVAAIYARARRETPFGFPPLGGRKYRPLTEKHLELAAFAAEEEGSWQELLDRWNARHPEWRYQDRRTFARDAKAAFERVTGWRWEGPGGGRGPGKHAGPRESFC